MGHLVKYRQGVQSTKPKLDNSHPTPTPEESPIETSKELHVRIDHLRKLYTDDTGRFPISSCSGNEYLIISYHCNSNAILVAPFMSGNYSHRLLTYNKILTWLKNRDELVDLQILYNGSS